MDDGVTRRVAAEMMDRLHRLRNERHRLEDSLAEVDRRAGELAGKMLERGSRRATIAQTLGVSTPHVGTLVSRAQEAPAGPFRDQVPVIPFYEGRRYFDDTTAQLEVLIAGNEPLDVLLESGLDPARFSDGDYLAVPHMLWRTSAGRWIGVDGVNVGYGGTGPGHARELLGSLGFGHQITGLPAQRRFFRVDVDGRPGTGDAPEGTPKRAPDGMPDGAHEVGVSDGGADGGVDGSSVRISAGHQDGHRGRDDGTLRNPRPVGPVFVVEFDRDEFRFHSSSEESLTPYKAWIDRLDAEGLPEWLTGERVARVFTDRQEAFRQGFVGRFRPLGELDRLVYVLVIEQGRLQLWLPDYVPLDPTQPVSDEAYEALAYAGLYPDNLGDLAPQTRFVHYWRQFLGNPRPAYIDISRSAKAHLFYTPSSDASLDDSSDSESEAGAPNGGAGDDLGDSTPSTEQHDDRRSGDGQDTPDADS